MTDQLPDDVLEYLRRHAYPGFGSAKRLLDKYAPAPKEMSDVYEVRYERVAVDMYGIRFREANHPDGVNGMAWPDDGGVCGLLNHGWELKESDRVEGLDIYDPRAPLDPWDGDTISSYAKRQGVLLLARQRSN